ncbi:hypothetical protein JXK06_00400 [Patescibacteria group bacterium]|nr:hypothetical protein [Patescibacteria group bacterium]
MKKIILFILLLGFFGAEQVWAQARVFNSTNDKIVVSDLKGLNEIVINPKSSGVAMFLPSDGIAKFNLARYEGFNKISLGEASRLAKGGKIALKDLSLDDGSAAQTEKAGAQKAQGLQVSGKESVKKFGSARIGDDGEVHVSSDSTINLSTGSTFPNRSSALPETDLVLSNKSSYRLSVLDGIFKGFALASEQASVGSKRTTTGKLTFSLYFDPEVDSISSGRNHRWAVINKIIVEGQDSLHITDSDLSQISSGERTEKATKNNFNIDFLVVAGPNAGTVISAKRMTQLDLNIGWNYVPIEYLSNDGLPVRSILLLMVNDSKKPIIINRRSDADLDSVNPDEIVFSGAN